MRTPERAWKMSDKTLGALVNECENVVREVGMICGGQWKPVKIRWAARTMCDTCVEAARSALTT